MTISPPQTDLPDTHRHLLRRCPHRRVVAGVAAGLADYLDVDVAAVRIALVLFAFIGGVAIPLYLAAWFLVPDEETGTSVAEDLLAGQGPERRRGDGTG